MKPTKGFWNIFFWPKASRNTRFQRSAGWSDNWIGCDNRIVANIPLNRIAIK